MIDLSREYFASSSEKLMIMHRTIFNIASFQSVNDELNPEAKLMG
jgi:hypothetical protein